MSTSSQQSHLLGAQTKGREILATVWHWANFLHAQSDRIPPSNRSRRCCPHFTDEEIEAQRSRHTSREERSWDWYPGRWTPAPAPWAVAPTI